MRSAYNKFVFDVLASADSTKTPTTAVQWSFYCIFNILRNSEWVSFPHDVTKCRYCNPKCTTIYAYIETS